MKRKNLLAASSCRMLFSALLCFLGYRSDAAVFTSQQELAAANANFAFNMLQQLATAQPGSNIFISPYSISTVLQMVSTGAEGTTRTQMQQMLGTINMKQEALNEANRNIASIIDSRNTNFLLTTANAVWYRSGLPVEPAFIRGDEQYFGAKVEGLDFNSDASVGIINAWASNETRGKIDQIIQGPIDPSVQMFLANAVYFLGNWESPFDTNNTVDQAFYLTGGTQATVPMMHQATSFKCYQGSGFQAVQLPYKGGDLAMYVFLPGSDSSVPELLGMMNGAWWQQTIQQDFSEESAAVALPKFELNTALNLNAPLEALGMTDAFTPDADFARISSVPLHISAVQHQAVVDVNETGTEAAAITTVIIVDQVAGPPPAFEINVNRPFLFFIQDQKAGTILFMGVVNNP
jgi:serine protease inhibitor